MPALRCLGSRFVAMTMRQPSHHWPRKCPVFALALRGRAKDQVCARARTTSPEYGRVRFVLRRARHHKRVSAQCPRLMQSPFRHTRPSDRKHHEPGTPGPQPARSTAPHRGCLRAGPRRSHNAPPPCHPPLAIIQFRPRRLRGAESRRCASTSPDRAKRSGCRTCPSIRTARTGRRRQWTGSSSARRWTRRGSA